MAKKKKKDDDDFELEGEEQTADEVDFDSVDDADADADEATGDDVDFDSVESEEDEASDDVDFNAVDAEEDEATADEEVDFDSVDADDEESSDDVDFNTVDASDEEETADDPDAPDIEVEEGDDGEGTVDDDGQLDDDGELDGDVDGDDDADRDADRDADAAAVGADFDEDEDLDVETEIQPQTSLLTIALCVLNVAAVIGFAILLVWNYEKRQAWSSKVLLHDLRIIGLPLREEEEEGSSAAHLMYPKQRLEPAALKEVYNKRGGKPFNEPFQEAHESLTFSIRPSYLEDKQLLASFFDGIGEQRDKIEPDDMAELQKTRGAHVVTLEEEVERLSKSVPADIAQAAADYLAALPKNADRRRELRDRLFLLTLNLEQVEALDKLVKDAPVDKLDEYLSEAVQRRMYLDALAPLSVYRPADERDLTLENAGDLINTKLSYLSDLLKRRMDAAIAPNFDPSLHLGEASAGMKRDPVEKRHAIAFLLTAIAHIRRPNDRLLYKFGPDRVMVLVGLHQYTRSYLTFADSHIPITARVVKTLEADRDGRPYEFDGKKIAMHAYDQKYRAGVLRILEMIELIKRQQLPLAEVNAQAKIHEDIVAERKVHVQKATDDLLKARRETAKLAYELRLLQREVFDADVALRNAIEDNLERAREIGRREGIVPDPKKKQ